MTTYVFRVRLHPNPPLGFEPDEAVWRDIEVDGTHTLADLHRAIFDAFDRWDHHAYEFITHDDDGVATRSYVDPQLYDGGPSWPTMDDEDIERFIEQGVPDDVSDDAKDLFRDLRRNPPPEADAAATTIDEIDPDQLRSLFYEFDFGDGWEHTLEPRETREGSLDGEPAVIAKQGAAPRQYPDVEE